MTLSKALLSDLNAELSSDIFLFDEDVRSRMAGIWRDDTIQARIASPKNYRRNQHSTSNMSRSRPIGRNARRPNRSG